MGSFFQQLLSLEDITDSEIVIRFSPLSHIVPKILPIAYRLDTTRAQTEIRKTKYQDLQRHRFYSFSRILYTLQFALTIQIYSIRHTDDSFPDQCRHALRVVGEPE